MCIQSRLSTIAWYILIKLCHKTKTFYLKIPDKNVIFCDKIHGVCKYFGSINIASTVYENS